MALNNIKNWIGPKWKEFNEIKEAVKFCAEEKIKNPTSNFRTCYQFQRSWGTNFLQKAMQSYFLFQLIKSKNSSFKMVHSKHLDPLPKK